MASLASTLTASEIIEHFKPTRPARVSFKSNWGNVIRLDEPSWRIVAFAMIAKLEAQESRAVPGLGNFGATDKAGNALRAYLLSIRETSLPFPRVIPASGSALLLVWTSGVRSIEIASFPDGEVVLETIEQGILNEELARQGLDEAVRWLVRR
jgi:hypothetical protein